MISNRKCRKLNDRQRKKILGSKDAIRVLGKWHNPTALSLYRACESPENAKCEQWAHILNRAKLIPMASPEATDATGLGTVVIITFDFNYYVGSSV